jgi:hypothetical protein
VTAEQYGCWNWTKGKLDIQASMLEPVKNSYSRRFCLSAFLWEHLGGLQAGK